MFIDLIKTYKLIYQLKQTVGKLKVAIWELQVISLHLYTMHLLDEAVDPQKGTYVDPGSLADPKT